MLQKRSKWKVPYIAAVFFKKRFLKKMSYIIKIRNSTIPSLFFNKRFQIYNGIWYKSKEIIKDILGFKFGEFSFTKSFDTQIQDKKVSKRKGKKHQMKKLQK